MRGRRRVCYVPSAHPLWQILWQQSSLTESRYIALTYEQNGGRETHFLWFVKLLLTRGMGVILFIRWVINSHGD